METMKSARAVMAMVLALVGFTFAQMQYSLWIEPDANLDPNVTTPAMLQRLQRPDPVSLVSLTANDTSTVAAVKRDPYGNFVAIPSNAVWTVIGDTGIVRISTPYGPYLCMIESLNYGNTFIRLSDTIGSLADTVPVSVSGGVKARLKVVNALTRENVTSVTLNVGQEITLQVIGTSFTFPDTNIWVDVTGTWTITPTVVASGLPLPTTKSSEFYFKPTIPGSFIITVTVGSGVMLDSISIPVTVSPADGLRSLPFANALEKRNLVFEYFNLRGQKIRDVGTARVNAVVLERIIGPGGKANMMRKVMGIGSVSRIRNLQ
jgi:hypothetical protein